MSEGEHTIISKIPRERLNQIASRKLTALALPVRLAADRETLEGDLAFAGKVVNPATGQPIPRARFTVVGHDQLRFSDPPLSALAPVNFYEADRLAALEQRVAAALQQRVTALQEIAARMRALRLEPAIDADRLAVRAVVKTTSHAFEVLGTPDGVRVSRVAPVGGVPFEVAPNFPFLELRHFPSLADLEVHLVHSVPAMQLAQPVPSRRAPDAALAGPARLEATPPPRNALTLAALSAAFGNDLMLAPNALVELIQEFHYGGTHYRFVASREMGTTFKGRLIGPEGDVWSDRFDIANFPGTRQVVAAALGASAEDVADDALPAPGASAPPLAALPQHLLPHPGEIWVMSVVVEESAADEVRYVGTDIDGKPYGAARVLKRTDFEAVFSKDRGGWRLLVVIDQVQDGSVLYRQLDRQKQPIGAPRKMATAILVANFLPEAAAY